MTREELEAAIAKAREDIVLADYITSTARMQAEKADARARIARAEAALAALPADGSVDKTQTEG